MDIETSSALAHQRGSLGVCAQVEMHLRVEVREGSVAAGYTLSSVQALQSWVHKAVCELLRAHGDVPCRGGTVTVCDMPRDLAEVGVTRHCWGWWSISACATCAWRGV